MLYKEEEEYRIAKVFVFVSTRFMWIMRMIDETLEKTIQREKPVKISTSSLLFWKFLGFHNQILSPKSIKTVLIRKWTKFFHIFQFVKRSIDKFYSNLPQVESWNLKKRLFHLNNNNRDNDTFDLRFRTLFLGSFQYCNYSWNGLKFIDQEYNVNENCHLHD